MVGKSVKGTLKSKQSQPSPPTLATESYGYALIGRVECLSANHPPVAPLRLQAYRDTARSLGYPLAVVSLGVHRTRRFGSRLSSKVVVCAYMCMHAITELTNVCVWLSQKIQRTVCPIMTWCLSYNHGRLPDVVACHSHRLILGQFTLKSISVSPLFFEPLS